MRKFLIIFIFSFNLVFALSFYDKDSKEIFNLDYKDGKRIYRFNDKEVIEEYEDNLLKKRDIQGDISLYFYDESNRLKKVEKNNKSTIYVRSEEGNLLFFKDEDGISYIDDEEDFSIIDNDDYFNFKKLSDYIYYAANWEKGEDDLLNISSKVKDDRIYIFYKDDKDEVKKEIIYDNNGNLISKKDDKVKIEYEYDIDNKLILTKEIQDNKIIERKGSESIYIENDKIVRKQIIKDDEIIRIIYKENIPYAKIIEDRFTHKTKKIEYL